MDSSGTTPFTVSPTSINIAAGQSEAFIVKFTGPDAGGAYDGTIYFDVSGASAETAAVSGTVDVCLAGNGGCSPAATCSGGVTAACTCLTGYMGNGATCVPVLNVPASSLTAVPATVLADGQTASAITVTAVLATGGPAEGAALTLSATNGAVLAPTAGITDANGSFVTTVTSNVPGVSTISATFGSQTLTATVTFSWECVLGSTKFSVTMFPVSVLDTEWIELLAALGLNHDGTLDLVFRGIPDAGLGTIPGEGNGTFGSPSVYQWSPYAQSFAFGDVNNDGLQDAVELTSQGDSSNAPWFYTVFLGNGADGFKPGTQYQIPDGASPWELTLSLGDTNGDENLDLVLSLSGLPSSDSDLSGIAVFLGNGDGTFGAPTELPVPIRFAFDSSFNFTFISAADLNRDRLADIVGVGSWLPEGGTTPISELVVYTSSPDGGFLAPIELPQPSNSIYPYDVDTPDVNCDGYPDILAPGGTMPHWGELVYLNDRDGGFAPGIESTSSVLSWFPAVGDLNGDGIVDLVFSAPVPFYENGVQTSGWGPSEAFVSFGGVDGRFGADQTCDSKFPLFAPVIGDFNGDGKLDIVAVSPPDAGQELIVLINEGN